MKKLPSLQWFRCTLSLTATTLPQGKGAHPLSVYEAIIKGITEAAQLHNQLQVCFYCPQQHANHMKIEFDSPITLQVNLFGGDTKDTEKWITTALNYFDTGNLGRNFTISCTSPFQKFTTEAYPTAEHTEYQEICLDFKTPIPFKSTRGKPRGWIGNEEFTKIIQQRLKKLFGYTPTLPSTTIDILPYYWSYYQISHHSNSQHGHVKYLNGCIGRLYIKAAPSTLQQWIPWLQLAESIGIGGKTSFGLGRFTLLLDSPSYFASSLANPILIQHAMNDVLEQSDENLSGSSSSLTGANEIELVYEVSKTIQSKN